MTWPIKLKASHTGLLHKKLHVPKSKKISVEKLMVAKKSRSPSERKEATFALNARKWKRK